MRWLTVLLAMALVSASASAQVVNCSRIGEVFAGRLALSTGAMDEDGVWHAAVELEQVRNTVGSGDCFLAGMAVALQRGEPLGEALRLAVACGAANAMDVETGYVRPDQVEALLGRVRVQAWKH